MDPGNTRSVGGSCVRAIQGENGRVRGLRVPSKRMTRSRRVSGIAAVLVAAFSLSSCNGAPAKTATLVPWLALTPLSTTTSTSTSTTTAIAPAPPCVASHLRVSMGQGEGAMSNEVFLVLITNVASTCRLSGYPDLIGRTSTRPLGALVVGKTGTYFGNLIPANLATGQRGELLLSTSSACNALNEPSQTQNLANARADTYHGVTIILPNGAGALSVPHIILDVACGLEESQLGVPAPSPYQYNAPPGSPQSLEASVTMPRSVQSGRTLRFVVTLYNPASKAVSWADCPNYTELIRTMPQVARSQKFSRTYQLNCAQAQSVRPRHSVSFVMELPVGSVANSSEAKFSWQLDTGYGPYAGRAVRVEASQ